MFNTNVNSEQFDPSGNKEPHVISSTNGNLSLLFNLGQLNVDASMGVNPIFQAIENLEVDVPDASVNVVSEVSWYSSANKGWKQVFKFGGDGEDLNDVEVEDLLFYTEPDSWLQLDDSSYINLLKDSKTTGSSSNANVGDPDASTAMDYLRDLTNKMLGQTDEGSQMGVLNLFDNVDDLIDDVNNLGNNVRDKQKDVLKLSRGDVNGVPNVDASGNALPNTKRESANIPYVILTKMLQNVDGFNRITVDTLAESNSNNVEFVRETKTSLLREGDQLGFLVTVSPTDNLPTSNTVESNTYKLVLTLRNSYDYYATELAAITNTRTRARKFYNDTSNNYFDVVNGYFQKFNNNDSWYTSMMDYINNSNIKPIASDITYYVNSDASNVIQLLGKDLEDTIDNIDNYHYLAHQPTKGILSWNNTNNFTYYLSSEHTSGTDSFTYKIKDSNNRESEYATVTLIILGGTVDISYSLYQDTSATITLPKPDIDLNNLTYGTTGNPQKGIISLSGNNVSYTPNTGVFGNDSFNYSCTHNSNIIFSGIVNVIIEKNTKPVANDLNITINRNSTSIITLEGYDEYDGTNVDYLLNIDNFTFLNSNVDTTSYITPNTNIVEISNNILDPLNNNYYILSGNTIKLTPTTNNAVVDDLVYYKVRDSQGEYSVTDASITIDISNSYIENNQFALHNSVSDINVSTIFNELTLNLVNTLGVDHYYQIIAPPQHGTLNIIADTVFYTPNLEYVGIDKFTYKICIKDQQGTIINETASAVAYIIVKWDEDVVNDNVSISL